jgi:hypothetical protein
MKSLKRLSIPMLLGVLLIATTVGVGGARPNARPLAQAWRVLTVPAGACVSRDEGHAWWHTPTYLECWETSATCAFLCAVNFPSAGEQAVGAVSVKRMTMYVYDNNGSSDPSADLYKVYPPTGGGVIMAGSGATGTSAADPRAVLDTGVTNNPVYRSQAPYIWLDIPNMNIKVYGFFIHYTW